MNRWASVGVDEAILKCVVKCGLLRRAELEKIRYFFIHWWRCVFVSLYTGTTAKVGEK